MTEGQGKRQRGTRGETTEAILDAAERLFSDRGYTAVSVREIAAEAGVSHALVHRYLGSKEQVYRRMLVRNETVISDAAPGEDELIAATSLMLREAWLQQRRYLRLVAHSALHGLSFDRTSGRFAATERLVLLAERANRAEGGRQMEDSDVRFVIASLVAMLLGWSAAKDWLLPAAGIGGLSEEEFLSAFERLLQDVERLYFPSAGAPSAE